jgi:hypothetical protein
MRLIAVVLLLASLYSKDMGALFLNAELLWIEAYNLTADGDQSDIYYRPGELSILEKRFPRTFSSCNGCFEPTTVHRLRITPDSIDDLGELSRAPELDLIDDLFWRIAHNQTTSSIATPQVAATLRKPVSEAAAESKKIDPAFFYVGMLGDWSVVPTPDGSKVCFTSDDLGRLTFTLHKDPQGNSLIAAVTRSDNDNKPCPIKGAIRHN